MMYLVGVAVALIGLVVGLRIRRRYLARVFQDHMDIQVSVLLAKERRGRRRAHGSLILELKHYDENLQSIYITSIRSKNEKIHVKYFSGLLFEVNRANREDTRMLSIGIRMSNCAEDNCRQHKESVYVEGKLYFMDKTKKSFGKDIVLSLIR
ncbi:hypothetical protein G5B30_16185 [Sphingobacterium sp. SGG-5]|uniref:hypothetical protein n=1 Tax=Sphingobacterium sp. SGG-5 TaxID=2710881 RepID=UPI0013EC5491|nr:hypothetical protein [Sphingobacterium sp. SGG-5]NGM63448.1 hypothetical protein [Sphingobacterium sp. SGG-5]